MLRRQKGIRLSTLPRTRATAARLGSSSREARIARAGTLRVKPQKSWLGAITRTPSWRFCALPSRSLKNPTGGSTAKPSSDLLRAGGADARNGEEAGDDADAAVPRSGSAGEGPAAEGEGAGGRGAARAVAGIRRDVQRGGPALDPAGAAAEGVALDRLLLGAQRDAVLRAAQLQPALSLAPRHEHGRGRVRAGDLQQESRTADEAPGREPLFRQGGRAGTSGGTNERRALHGGRDADRRVGVP